MSSFGGCEVNGRYAICDAKVRYDQRDEINSGHPGLYGDMAAAMRATGNAMITAERVEMRFRSGEWHVQMDASRLFGR